MEKDEATGRAKGGIARAEILSPERRSEIARKAAKQRWNTTETAEHGLPKAEYNGILRFKTANVEIPCAVLEGGTRVLSENGITNALLGSRSGASKRLKRVSQEQGAPVPLFLAPGNLNPFITQDLIDGPFKPIKYQVGNKAVVGFDASILPAACDVWLKARDAGALQEQQLGKARKAEILMRGLAHVGIIGLVDEATGYQEVRDRKALQEILDRFIGRQLAKWAKTFPDEFYSNVFKLKGWTFQPGSSKRPRMMAKLTADLVYSRLAPGVLEELRRKSPKDEKGRRKNKLFQWLTTDVGHPALRDHLSGVIFLAKANNQWDVFYELLGKAAPQYGKTMLLPFPDETTDI